MIDFRYHLVSIVAVFLALAIGIVLGAAELQGPTYNILNHTTAKLQNELNEANSQLGASQRESNASEAYAAAVEPSVLHDLLAGQRLVIVTEPGAQSSVISGISTAAADAGATVTGQINLQSKFFDTSDTTEDTLNQVNEDVAEQAGIVLGTGTTYQQQAAQVIAREILTKATSASDSTAADSTVTPTSTATPTPTASATGSGGTQGTGAQTMLQAYDSNGFLSTTGQPATQATLAVVVTPQTAPSDGTKDPLSQLLVPLAQELAAKSSATVVAGSSGASGAGSPIAVLRANNIASQVSSVDDADLVSGQSVVAQALAVLLNGGKAGNYGFTDNGASAVAPSPMPSPSPSDSSSPTPTSSAKEKSKK